MNQLMNINVSNEHGEISARVGNARKFDDEGDPSVILSSFEGKVAWIDSLYGQHIGGGAVLLSTLIDELKRDRVHVVGLMAVPKGADPEGAKGIDSRRVASLTRYYERFGFAVTNESPWDYFPVMLLHL